MSLSGWGETVALLNDLPIIGLGIEITRDFHGQHIFLIKFAWLTKQSLSFTMKHYMGLIYINC